jgi:hypothetical protein
LTSPLPVIDLWQRRTANGVVITGSFAGVKLMLYRIVDAPEDGPHWHLYFAPRQQAIERDRALPTTATAPDDRVPYAPARPQRGRHGQRSPALDLPDLIDGLLC